MALRERLERAKSTGDLPAESNPSNLARFVTTVFQGMAIQAANGASREDLESIVQIVLRAWPF